MSTGTATVQPDQLGITQGCGPVFEALALYRSPWSCSADRCKPPPSNSNNRVEVCRYDALSFANPASCQMLLQSCCQACREECERQLDVDLGHLLAVHPSAPDDPAVLEGSEEALQAFATKCTQSLVRQIFTLPSHASDAGRAVTLPAPALALPRAKPLPQPKPLTKWQKFAQEKGIVKRKKSKLEFDEASQDWKRRHGYSRANDPAAVPVIEASAADEGYEDPFHRLEDTQQRGQKRGREATASGAADSTAAPVVPSTVKLTSRLDPDTVKGQIAKGKALKGDIAKASELAGISTASMGKFDQRLKGEKGERKLPGLRQKHLPTAGGGAESGMVANVLGKVTRKDEGELVDVRRAVGNLQASKSRRRKDKDGDSDGGSDNADPSKRKKGRVGRVKNRRVPKKSAAPKAGVAKKGKGGGKKRK